MKNTDLLTLRRQHIFEAAMACFIHGGFHQTSMRDIAQAAGVSLGNVYNHFENKEALIREIASAEAEELVPLMRLFEPLEINRSKTERKAHQHASTLKFAHAYLAICRQSDYVKLSCEVIAECARHPEIAQLFAANRHQLCSAISDFLCDPESKATSDQSALAAQLAHSLLDLIEGWSFRQHLWKKTSHGTSKAQEKRDEQSLFIFIESLLHTCL